MDAYLDIETSFSRQVSVVGIYFEDGRFLQLYGEEVTADNLIRGLTGINTVYTYNGDRFDLPVIKRKMLVDIRDYAVSHDLMYDCWARNLYGGLKKVEECLGISRDSRDINGFDAMRLWEQFIKFGDEKALSVLLYYNREDTVNLSLLRARLGV